MTALAITYEDGLRLAELTGRMNGLEYEASHIFATHLAELALSAVLGMVIAILVWDVLCAVLDNYSKDNSDKRYEQRLMLGMGLFIAFPVIAVILGWVCVNASVDLQMVEVQGQMDVILAKYGGMA